MTNAFGEASAYTRSALARCPSSRHRGRTRDDHPSPSGRRLCARPHPFPAPGTARSLGEKAFRPTLRSALFTPDRFSFGTASPISTLHSPLSKLHSVPLSLCPSVPLSLCPFLPRIFFVNKCSFPLTFHPKCGIIQAQNKSASGNSDANLNQKHEHLFNLEVKID